MAMLNVAKPLEVVKTEAQSLVRREGRPYIVVVGYDDYDRLAWTPIPASEWDGAEDVIFRTPPAGKWAEEVL